MRSRLGPPLRAFAGAGVPFSSQRAFCARTKAKRVDDYLRGEDDMQPACDGLLLSGRSRIEVMWKDLR